MATMSSRMQGIKIKEVTDHVYYKDIWDNNVFSIYYASGTWRIVSEYDRLFTSDGTSLEPGHEYFAGETIFEFSNGTEASYSVLGQYDQEDTDLFRNILYKIEVSKGTDGEGTRTYVKLTGGDVPITYDNKSILDSFKVLHTHVKVYYNGKWHDKMYLVYDNPSVAGCWMKKVGAIALTYADPNWFLMSTQSGVEFGGRTYESHKLLKTWSGEDSVNLLLKYSTSKKRNLPNPDVDKFDKLVYDVQCFAPDGKVILTYEVNQVPQDSITFYPADSPVIFHNIEFRANTNWTIISKCGFIKYDGKTYKNNRSIVSIGFDENLHIEVQDQSNIYEINKTTYYSIKSERVVSTTYKVWTAQISKTLKVEKTVNGIAEPWHTIHYYDGLMDPLQVDDLIFEFDGILARWYLRSNNDMLYSDGVNYKKGEIIANWSYKENVHFNNIMSLIDSTDGIELTTRSTGDVQYLGNDLDEVYDEGILICHDSIKEKWELKSVNDRTYYMGMQFLEGQVIRSFKDGLVIEEFSILVQKEVEGEQVNVLYQCYTDVDIINDITTLHVNGGSWNNKGLDEDNVTITLTKENCKSMYGYIWSRYGEGPTPPPKDYDYDVVAINLDSSVNGYRYIAEISTTFGARIAKKVYYSQYYNIINTGDYWETARLGDVAYLISRFSNSLYFRGFVNSGTDLTFSQISSNPPSGYMVSINNVVMIFKVEGNTSLTVSKYTYDKYLYNQQDVDTETYTDETPYLGTYRCIEETNESLIFESNVTPFRYLFEGNYYYLVEISKDSLAIIDRKISMPITDLNYERMDFSVEINGKSIRALQKYGDNDFKFYAFDDISKQILIEEDYLNEWPTYYGDNIHCNNNKMYVYYIPIDGDGSTIDIYESDYDVESMFTDQTKVDTVTSNDTIQIFRIDTRVYETFNKMDVLPINKVKMDTLLFNSTTKRFGENKRGYFTYINLEPYGSGYYANKMIVYIDDPTFQNTNNNFAFIASALRYLNVIGDT